MDMVVETGEGLANSNSLCALAVADTYHQTRQNTKWVDAPAQVTLYLPSQPVDEDTLIIAGVEYVFTPGDPLGFSHPPGYTGPVQYQVKIGDTLAQTQANLVMAINATGVDTVQYGAGVVPNPSVSATMFTGNAATLIALVGGVAGNTIAVSTDVGDPTIRFSSPTLTGGQPSRANALMTATLYMEARYRGRWNSRRTKQLQALSWPRTYVTDPDGFAVNSNVVPIEVQQACAELALRVLLGDDLMPDVQAGQGNISSESVSVGPVSTSTSYLGPKTTRKKYPIVDQLLKNYIRPPGQIERC